MKICFLTDTIFSVGGIQRVVSAIASELTEYHNVSILCTNSKCEVNSELYNLDERVNIIINPELVEKKISTKVYSKGIKIINERTALFNKKKFVNYLTEIYYPKEIQDKIVNFLNDENYDIVIGVAGNYSLLLGILSDRISSKTMGWQHNSFDAYFKTPKKYQWKKDFLYKEYISNLDEYIVLTDADKENIDREFNIESSRIYNPLSFTSNEKSLCEEKRIVSIGRLVEEQKGFDLLINAFKKVSLKHRDWNLCIVGDGPDKKKMNKLIDQLNLTNQIKIEPFTNDVKQYYLSSSIFVSSSRWEGFGLVITEAMECGLPIIAFANSGPKEIINKNYENGILVPCENIDELSNAMVDLIENEEKRIKISKEAINRAKDFSTKKIVAEWNGIIAKLNI